MPGEFKDWGMPHGLWGINDFETSLPRLTWASLNFLKDHLGFQGQHDERGIDYSEMGKVKSHFSLSAETSLGYKLSQRRHAQNKVIWYC